MIDDQITAEFRDISSDAADPSYQEGVTAWRDEHPDTVCPYVSGGTAVSKSRERMLWMSGYYDASIYHVLKSDDVTNPPGRNGL